MTQFLISDLGLSKVKRSHRICAILQVRWHLYIDSAPRFCEMSALGDMDFKLSDRSEIWLAPEGPVSFRSFQRPCHSFKNLAVNGLRGEVQRSRGPEYNCTRRPTKLGAGYTGFTLSVRPSVCRRHGFRSASQVCLGIAILYFMCMLIVTIGISLLIFGYATFKMAAWWPYLDFLFSLTFNINCKLQ